MSPAWRRRPPVAFPHCARTWRSSTCGCRTARASKPADRCGLSTRPSRALILTSYDDQQALATAVLAGASGFLLKDIKGNGLVTAIQRVAAGENLLDTDQARRLRATWSQGDETDPRLRALSPQERRILDHVAAGMTNRQIGDAMSLAEKTVKNYVTSVLAKLGMERRTQAAVYAATHQPQQPHRPTI